MKFLTCKYKISLILSKKERFALKLASIFLGKLTNTISMQVPFCKMQKAIQGSNELNQKIDNLHWQCRSPSGTCIVAMSLIWGRKWGFSTPCRLAQDISDYWHGSRRNWSHYLLTLMFTGFWNDNNLQIT